MYVAITDIKHGAEDGSIITVDAGQEVPSSEFTDEELEHFLEIGSIMEPIVVEAAERKFESAEEIQAEIDRLQSLHAQLENGTLEGTAEGSTAPGNANGGEHVDPDDFVPSDDDDNEIT
jgi:hypothetical protein